MVGAARVSCLGASENNKATILIKIKNNLFLTLRTLIIFPPQIKANKIYYLTVAIFYLIIPT
jgi:hypothetical protein